ncbi:MAG: hypothetical protein J6328_06340 [Bacilli bacterium]|nr:hypothetical protein [Bacilli bacterium]
MKKLLFALPLFAASAALFACGGNNEKTITIAASELPHAKILNEAIKPVLKEKGYDLKVTVLEWTQQNPAVARGEYDANYFQHLPYLNTYNAEASEDNKLQMVVKVHFEKLCLYASDLSHKELQNGDTIEIVNDVSNIERALLLLKDHGVITEIAASCYDADGTFTFNTTNPNSQVTFASNYSNCSITCIQESNLAVSLPDFDFGVIPGNAALTGLGNDYASRIVFGENVTEEILSLRANGVAVKKKDANSDKSKALVDAFAADSVKNYIVNTFGDSVVYHYENLIA